MIGLGDGFGRKNFFGECILLFIELYGFLQACAIGSKSSDGKKELVFNHLFDDSIEVKMYRWVDTISKL